MTTYLVCEGPRQGLDERVLDAMVVQFHNLATLMRPAGGDRGLGAVRAYLEGISGIDVAITIADRNYRPHASSQATWARLGGKDFIWRRHEIENYLFHPRVVLELFNDFRALAGLTWAISLPASETDVSALLRSLAVPFLETHAAQVLKDEIVRQINGVGSMSYGPSRPAPTGGAPAPGQAEWLATLQQEAARLGNACLRVSGLQTLQGADISARYNALLGQFTDPAFLASDDYLIEMAGKELMAALSRYLAGLGAPAKLDKDALGTELLKVLQRIYQPNVLYQPDDFAELAGILKQF